MKDDYTSKSHSLTYTLLFRKFEYVLSELGINVMENIPRPYAQWSTKFGVTYVASSKAPGNMEDQEHTLEQNANDKCTKL